MTPPKPILRKERPELYDGLLIAFIVAQASFTIIYGITRLYTYKASLLDLGVFDQILWLMSHWQMPVTTAVPPYTPLNWLGFHFSPILVLLVPVYWIVPCPETLIVVQSLCFAGTAFILYQTALKFELTHKAALGFAFLYLINPYVLSAALFDFHEIALAMPIMAAALYAVMASNSRLFLWMCLLLMLTKEHYGLAVAGLAILWASRHDAWGFGWVMSLVSVAAMIGIIGWAMPYFAGAHAHQMLEPGSSHMARFAWMSYPPGQAWDMLMHLLFSGEGNLPSVVYWIYLPATVLLLPLFAPFFWLPALADLAVNSLSLNHMLRSVFAYHSAPIIPVMIVAGMQVWQRMGKMKRRGLWFMSILALIVANSVFLYQGAHLKSPLRLLSVWELGAPQWVRPSVPKEVWDALPNGAIAVQNNIGPFFAYRRYVRPFPQYTGPAEATVLYLDYPYRDLSYAPFSSPWGDSTEDYVREVRKRLDDSRWKVVVWQEPWLVLKHDTTEGNEAWRQEARRALNNLK